MRNLYIVNAYQVVISEANPQGLFSSMSGYPKTFDSRSYPAPDGNPNGDEAAALNAAKSDFYARLSAIYVGSATRVMATVTLERADGRQVMRESIGGFPDMTPEPPEPEPEEPEA